MSIVCNPTGHSLAHGIARRWFHRRVIFFGAVTWFVISMLSGPVFAGSVDGPAIHRPSDDSTIILSLNASSTVVSSLSASSPQEHLVAAKRALVQFRRTANPRYLGDVDRELAAIPDSDRSGRFYFYHASLKQSLHLFDEALADLNTLSQQGGDSLESLMMRFSISFVSGEYQDAEKACTALKNDQNNLYAASCSQQLHAATGDAEKAYHDLKLAMAKSGLLADRQALAWATGTLADIAERAGRDDSVAIWQLALQLEPDDLYTRARLAGEQLRLANYQDVIVVSKDYLAVDALAVSAAIAQKQLGEGEQLIAMLRKRFDEALWRGEILHKRAYAQFLLDIEQDAQAALVMAEENWAHQREWPDEVILARARAASRGAEPL